MIYMDMQQRDEKKFEKFVSYLKEELIYYSPFRL